MLNKLLIILLVGISLVQLSSALCNQNNIFTENNTMDICGICRVNYFDTPCVGTTNCTLSIYTENRTMLLNNTNMLNQSDGVYIYNYNLSSGEYIGEMACEGKLASFEILVNPISSGLGAVGPGFPLGYFDKENATIITYDRLVKDINSFFDNTSEYLFPTKKILSIIIIIVLLLILMMYKEIIWLIKKVEWRKK